MPVNYINAGQFTIGPNNSVSIFETLTNNQVDWGFITQIDWSSHAIINRVPVNLMSGTRIDIPFLNGWTGEFTIERTNSNLDTYWSLLESSVRAGLPYPNYNIIQYIKETDGTLTQCTFYGALITYDEAGRYANEEGVVQRLMFTAPAREAVKV